MNPLDPYNMFYLSGTGTMRYMTIALPTEVVRRMLPNGLELGPQDLTPEGTHPIMMGFHDMFRLHTSIPSLLPSMTYHEHSVGIPYCYINQGQWGPSSRGPYFFMPSLLLDHVLATVGGVLFWGFAKHYCHITNVDGHFRISRRGGPPVLTFDYENAGEAEPIAKVPEFETQRQALAQTVVSTFPAGMGPYFILSEFPKQWEVATIRPLTAVTEIYSDYVIGFAPGRYPEKDRSPGIASSVMGAYELSAPWRLTAPYPVMPS